MKDATDKPNEYKARERKNTLSWLFWVFAYAISLVLSSVILTQLPTPKLLLGISALLITVGFGIAAFVAFTRLLKGLDERLQRIWLESLAITFGVLWIAFGCLVILHRADINHIDAPEMGLLSLLAGLGFAVGAIRTIR